MTAALKQRSRTVPELASELDLDTSVVMWNLMAMKRYGLVAEGDRRGDYFEYSLVEKE